MNRPRKIISKSRAGIAHAQQRPAHLPLDGDTDWIARVTDDVSDQFAVDYFGGFKVAFGRTTRADALDTRAAGTVHPGVLYMRAPSAVPSMLDGQTSVTANIYLWDASPFLRCGSSV